MYASWASLDAPTILTKSSGTGNGLVLSASTPLPWSFSALCLASSSMVCAWRHSVTFSVRGNSLSASCSSFPFGDSMAAFQRMCAGTLVLFASSLDLKSSKRCLTNRACVATSASVTPRASAAPASNCVSLGCDIPVFLYRSIIMVLWSQRSGSGPDSPCPSSGISKRPSCTGCSMMSHRATVAHRRHSAQAPRRMVSRCFPGSALSLSLLTTRSGSRRSTRMSRQPSK
mmetsp:Transcript_71983/g.188654  ORF Transcript_71983/g.188654 Transcript_71983/m.188654 type:complete len:229 (+) Transcript_71983:225-911(+)